MKQDKIDNLISLLKASRASAWEITDTTETGWEFYLIGDKLDQHRVRDVNHVHLRVFTKGEDEGTIGSAEGEISPTADTAELTKSINTLLDASGYALNPAWTLNQPAQHTAESDAPCPEVDKVSADYLHTLTNLSQDEHAYINSSEVFVTKVTKRIINSEGLDVTDTYPSSMAEVIVNAKDQEHEIELYRMFTSGTCDTADLESRLSKAMRYGKDKLIAKPTPGVGSIDLILSTEDAFQIFYWYAAHLNAAYKYMGYSDWNIGQPITESDDGDKLTIIARSSLPNSSRNCRFDSEGAYTHDLTLMKDNTPAAFYGTRQFSQYLGLKDSFNAGNLEFTGGIRASESLLEGDYLEVVEFSSFEVDDVSGDLAGEIRLGYLHRQNQVTIVSGGSVSGNMADLIKTIRFSHEMAQYDNYLIPSVTRLRNVSIAGGQLDT